MRRWWACIHKSLQQCLAHSKHTMKISYDSLLSLQTHVSKTKKWILSSGLIPPLRSSGGSCLTDKEMRRRVVGWLAQGHTASQRESLGSTPGTGKQPLKNSLDSAPKWPESLIENTDSWGRLLDSDSVNLEWSPNWHFNKHICTPSHNLVFWFR